MSQMLMTEQIDVDIIYRYLLCHGIVIFSSTVHTYIHTRIAQKIEV